MGKIKLVVTVILCFALLGFFVARVSAEKISLPITGGVYQMITSPILPADPDPQVSLEVYLGPYDKTQWRFFRYDPAQSRYIELKTPDWSQEQDFDFGRGYWIISRNPAEIDIEGDPVDVVGLNQIVLKVGWNQIGNIYLQDFTIGMFPDCNLWVQPVNPGPLESSYQLNDLDNPYTHWTLKEYVEGLPYADIGLGLGEKLEKGKGYWLKNTYGRDVILSFDPAGLTAVSTSANFPGPGFFARVAQQEDPPDPPPGFTSSFSSGSSSGSVGCFIATAVYQDYDHPNVRSLRQFRDRYLLTNSFGRMFVDMYYRYSPTLAKFVANRDSVKTLVRFTLMPIVGLSSLVIKMNVYGFQIVLAFSMLIGFVLLRVSGGGGGKCKPRFSIKSEGGKGKR